MVLGYVMNQAVASPFSESINILVTEKMGDLIMKFQWSSQKTFYRDY